MSNSEIRSRAWQIYKDNLILLIGATFIITLLNVGGDKLNNPALSLIMAVITTVLQVGIYYINFRAWVDGSAKWNQLNIPLTQPAYRKRLLPVLLVQNSVILLSAVPLLRFILLNMDDPFFFMMNGVMILLLFLLIIVAAVAVGRMWYIYIVKPELKTGEILKKSAVYMSRHWGEELWFSITITFIPAIITAIMIDIIDPSVLSLLLVPVQAYISLAITGFVYERIILVEQARENLAEMLTESAIKTTEETTSETLPPETLPVEHPEKAETDN